MLTISTAIVAPKPPDGVDMTAVCAWHLASAVTVYEPPAAQLCDALVDADHDEYVPSPQLNRYSTTCPTLLVAPPVL